jgi:hypothetical protein
MVDTFSSWSAQIRPSVPRFLPIDSLAIGGAEWKRRGSSMNGVSSGMRIGVAALISASFGFGFRGEAYAGSVTLRLGDAVRIAHTPVYSIVLRSRGIAISCFAGDSIRKAIPESYGVTVSSHLASMARFISATQTRLVVSRKEPSVVGKRFPAPKRRHAMIFFLRFDDRVLIGGTDIACGVGGKVGKEAIVCREADVKLDSIPGTWGVSIDSRTASIARYIDRHDNISGAIIRNQP